MTEWDNFPQIALKVSMRLQANSHDAEIPTQKNFDDMTNSTMKLYT
jgi:hypothetical protein